MYKILIVEDSLTVRSILTLLFEKEEVFECVHCVDFLSAKKALDNSDDYFAAIVDLNLPDAPNGEIVNLTLEHEISTVVLTGNFDESLRASLLKQGVLDYITKESQYSYLQAVKFVNRLRKNLSVKVLVVDDSKLGNNFLCSFLSNLRFNVVSAVDGEQALDTLKGDNSIKLVISDYMMPKMDGFELIRNIRADNSFSDLIFIGVSSNANSLLSAKFIKSGANDFLSKPFNHEEFLCRIFQNLDSQEMMAKIKASAYLDPLTGIPNRRSLFERAESMLNFTDIEKTVSIAMIDVDNFKQVNDVYGHKIGDNVLEEFSELIKKHFDGDNYGRYGGEEFAIFSELDESEVSTRLKLFIKSVRNHSFTAKSLSLTCSIGNYKVVNNTLPINALIEKADARLYKAKHSGKDQIVHTL